MGESRYGYLSELVDRANHRQALREAREARKSWENPAYLPQAEYEKQIRAEYEEESEKEIAGMALFIGGPAAWQMMAVPAGEIWQDVIVADSPQPAQIYKARSYRGDTVPELNYTRHEYARHVTADGVDVFLYHGTR